MGTRCLTVLIHNDGSEIVVLYRQFDGYLDGHGKELASLCANVELVNGIDLDKDPKSIANGMHCMAATIVAHFKDGIGGFYLHPAGTRDLWEDYVYTVTGSEGSEPNIKVESGIDLIFDGPASELLVFIESERVNDE